MICIKAQREGNGCVLAKRCNAEADPYRSARRVALSDFMPLLHFLFDFLMIAMAQTKHPKIKKRANIHFYTLGEDDFYELYFCLFGITPRTPPLGFSMSPV